MKGKRALKKKKLGSFFFKGKKTDRWDHAGEQLTTFKIQKNFPKQSFFSNFINFSDFLNIFRKMSIQGKKKRR